MKVINIERKMLITLELNQEELKYILLGLEHVEENNQYTDDDGNYVDLLNPVELQHVRDIASKLEVFLD